MSTVFKTTWEITTDNLSATLPFLDNYIWTQSPLVTSDLIGIEYGSYDIAINWGDGTVIRHIPYFEINEDNRFHVYSSAGTYNIEISTGELTASSLQSYSYAYPITADSSMAGTIIPITSTRFDIFNQQHNNFEIVSGSMYFNISNATDGVILELWDTNKDGWLLTDTSGISGFIDYNTGIGEISAPVGYPTEESYVYNTYIYKSTGRFKGWNYSQSPITTATPLDPHQIISIDDWGELELVNAEGTFAECINLTSIPAPTPTLFNNITSFDLMFYNASSFNDSSVTNWGTNDIISMEAMFQNAKSFNQSLTWNVSNVTNMSYMFAGARAFNQNINNWDVSNVTDMNNMFLNADSFNQNINNWDVRNVTDMSFMFMSAQSFNQSCEWTSISSLLSAEEMFVDTNLNRNNYNNLLRAWATTENIQSYVIFNAGSVQYGGADSTGQNAITARSTLTNDYNWTIYDNGLFYTLPDPADLLINWQCNGYSNAAAAAMPEGVPGVDPRSASDWEGTWVSGNLAPSGYAFPNLGEFQSPWNPVSTPYQPRNQSYNSGVTGIDISLNPIPSGISAENLQDVYNYINEFESVAVIQQFDWNTWNPQQNDIITALDFNKIGQALNDIKDKLICTQYENNIYCLSRLNRCASRCTSNYSPNYSTNKYTVCTGRCSTSHGRQGC
jgi:surface protein